MFSNAVKKVYTHVPGTEGYDVKNFLDNSTELKKMRGIALTSEASVSSTNNGLTITTNPIREIVNDLEKSLTFADILKATERLDFVNTTDPTVKKLGRNGMNTILFFGGFVSDEANLAYYALHLREKAIKIMADKGYKAEEENSVVHVIHQLGKR